MSEMWIPLNVPDIGNADKIELVVWNIQEGDIVAKDLELCELVTDKAAFPLEAPFSGRITKILKKAGETVKVNETLALIEKV